MSRLKKVALLSVSTVAVVAAIAAPAQAGTAEVIVDDGTGPSLPCDVTFDNTGAPPTSPITISNVVANTADPDCTVVIVDGGGTLTIGATASLDGNFTVDAGFWNCNYAGTLTGAAAATTLSGTATTGGFLCPASVAVTLQNIVY